MSGCDSIVTLVNLTINTGSSVFAGLDTNICSGNDLTLSASSSVKLTYNVTASNASDYTFSGSASGTDPPLAVTVGDTLVFNVNAPGHPFLIKTNNTTGTSGAITVANNGTSSGTITWIPDTPGTYYYICEYHAGMVGAITVSADANTYAWNNGVTDGTAFTPSNGYYVVTSTTSSGCTSQDSLLVTIVPSEDASFSYDTTHYCTVDADPILSMTGLPDTLIFDNFESYSDGYDYVGNNSANWWNNGGTGGGVTVYSAGAGAGGSDSYLVSGTGWNKLQYSFAPIAGATYQLQFNGALTAYYANNLKIQVIQLNGAGDGDDVTRQENVWSDNNTSAQNTWQTVTYNYTADASDASSASGIAFRLFKTFGSGLKIDDFSVVRTLVSGYFQFNTSRFKCTYI